MKTKFIFLIISFLLLVGCNTVPSFTSNNILNLRVVDASQNILRGGQPDAKGFIYLKSLGITNIIKLNLEDNEDAEATALGMTVVYIPINTYDQVIHLEKWKFEVAVIAITPNTFIHCAHGQDRTGLVVAGYRMANGMSKADAEKEMLANGFHKELIGLWGFFKKIN
jgi:protein tyrosine/serine phosphatase